MIHVPKSTLMFTKFRKFVQVRLSQNYSEKLFRKIILLITLLG